MKPTSLQDLISGLTESHLDISDKSFVNEEINQRNLEMSVLYKINLSKVNFRSTDFTGSNFIECDFENCLFDLTTFHKCDFMECTFRNCTLQNFSMTKSDLNEVAFENCELSRGDLSWSYSNNCMFKNTALDEIHLEGTMIADVRTENVSFFDLLFSKLHPLKFHSDKKEVYISDYLSFEKLINIPT